MCGIAGLINLRSDGPVPDRELALRMARALRHRGPDGFGIYRDRHVALTHSRLSIIDLDGGWQPMSNAAESIWICFNGEIFNYVELREQLMARGHRFRTKSDTEVLLHGYAEWGEAMVDRLNGQWAFVLWDAQRRSAFLARDRVGIAPLFWTVYRGVLRFASEVKAIFQDASVPRAFSREGLDETLTFWATVAPETSWHGIRQLPPGAVAQFKLDRDPEPKVVGRWCPTFARKDSRQPGREAAFASPGVEVPEFNRVRDSLNAGAMIRLRADVAVGCYLSGGLDSTIVAALVASNRSVPLRTFSVEFSDREFDETAYQRAVAADLGTIHTSIRCGDAEIAEVFPDVVYHAEVPLLRTAPAPLLLLSRLVHASGYRVVLTGEGADELFGGYDIFREDSIRRFWARQPQSALRPQLLQRLYPYLQRSPVGQVEMAKAFFGRNLTVTDDPFYAHRPRWEATARIKGMLEPSMRDGIAVNGATERLKSCLPEASVHWTPLQRAQYTEMVTLLSGYLLSSQGERMMMASSVEGRFPFLDSEVMAGANALPDLLKLRALNEKYILKRAMRGIVPSAILERKKQPYRAPVVKPFFADGVPEYVEACLSSSAIKSAGIWQPAAVSGLVAKCRRTLGRAMSNTDEMAFCAVLSTQILARDFIVGTRILDAGSNTTGRLGVDCDRIRDPGLGPAAP